MDDEWWLQHIFGRSSEAKTNSDDAELAANVSPHDAVGLMTRLFLNCRTLLSPFTDRQVAEGLVYLGSTGESDWMYYLYDSSIDQTVRFACIRSLEFVYRDCFSLRCLSNPPSRSSDLNAIDNICFMWWDRFPAGRLHPMIDDDREAVHGELIEVMARTLQIENAACQESALHGLGHFAGPDVQRARVAIDDWLASHPHSPLRAYAQAAREGTVQ